jgi:uncharacterized protein DUF3187
LTPGASLAPRAVIAVLGLALAAQTAAAAGAGPRTVRGPIESRDEFLLAQSLLTLPPLGAALPLAGRTELRVDLDWGNDFGLQAERGGRPENLLFFVDGEHRTLAATVRRGLAGGWAVGARIPLHWRGGGWLDTVIDPFHDLFGLPDSGRALYARGRLRVQGRTREGEPFEWTGRAGTGLGSVELEVSKAIRDGSTGGPAIAIVARTLLPTSTGAFVEAGRGAGASALLSQPLGAAFDLHAGGGATVLGPSTRDGLACARNRAHGFVTLEWRPVRAWSALVQWEASSRLLTDVDRYPGLQLSLRIGSKVDAGTWRLEGGFVEGIKSLDNTTDFGVFAAVGRRF